MLYIRTVYCCASPCGTWLKAAAGITMGPKDKNHVGRKHPPDYHGRVFPLILHRREEFASVTFLEALCPAHSSSTWDVWAGVDGQPLRLPKRPGRKDLHRQTAGKDNKHGLK